MSSHVVIVAFGPRATTRRAVERARGLVAPDASITVVPAWRHVGRGLGSLRSPLVRVGDGSGRPALEQALGRGAGTVLLVHDDVLVTPGALEQLERTHRATGNLAIPHSNELDTTGYVGSLPEARRAAAAIATTTTPVADATHAARFRTSCVLGRPDQVRRLLDARATDPRSVVHGWHEPVLLAPGAVVAHDSSCAQQLPPAEGPDGRPLLVAALIVRDEEAMLPDCLDSLAPLVDRIVVGDTGSTDRTVAIAEQHGAQVVTVAWRDDFAAARSEVLGHCGDAWYVLQVDADERVACEDPVTVRRRLAADVDEAAMFRVRIDNLVDGEVHTSFEGPRLLRPRGTVYSGALHETPVRADGRAVQWVGFAGLRLRHLGYDPVLVEGRGKQARNVEIARRAHATAPSAQTALNLLRSLAAAEQAPDEQAALAHDLLDTEGELTPEARAHVLGILGAVTAGEDAAAACRLYREALQLAPGEDLTARRHAELAFATNDLDAVVEVADARRAGELTAVFRSPREEAIELHHVALAHLAREDRAAARDVVGALLELAAPLPTTTWVDVVSVLVLTDGDAALDRLAAAAAQDASGGVLEAVSRVFPGEATASVVRDVARAGRVTARGLQVGLAAALVAGRHDLGLELAAHAETLPTEVIERLVAVATEKGADDVAAALAASLLLGV